MGMRIIQSEVTGAANQTRIISCPGGASYLIVEGPEGTFAYPILGNGEGPFRSPNEAVNRLAMRHQAESTDLDADRATEREARRREQEPSGPYIPGTAVPRDRL
jgi:hypothetical protein